MKKKDVKKIHNYSVKARGRVEVILQKYGPTIAPEDIMAMQFKTGEKDLRLIKMLKHNASEDDKIYFKKWKTTNNDISLSFVVVPSGSVDITVEQQTYSYNHIELISKLEIRCYLIRKIKMDKLSSLIAFDLTKNEEKLIFKALRFLKPLFADNYDQINWTPQYGKDLKENVKVACPDNSVFERDDLLKLFTERGPDLLRIFIMLVSGNIFYGLNSELKPKFVTTLIEPYNITAKEIFSQKLNTLVRCCDFCHKSSVNILSACEIKLDEKADVKQFKNYKNRLLILRATKYSAYQPIVAMLQSSLVEETINLKRGYPLPFLPILCGRQRLPNHVALNISNADSLIELKEEDILLIRNAVWLVLSHKNKVIKSFEELWWGLRYKPFSISTNYQSAWLDCAFKAIAQILFEDDDYDIFTNICIYEENMRKSDAEEISDRLSTALERLLDYERYLDKICMNKPETSEDADNLLDYKYYAFLYKTKGNEYLCFTDKSLKKMLYEKLGLEEDMYEMFIDFLKQNNVITSRTENIYLSAGQQKRFIRVDTSRYNH